MRAGRTSKAKRRRRLIQRTRDRNEDLPHAEAGDQGLGPIADVHTPEYLDYLQVAHREWSRLPGSSTEVIPNVHPGRRPAHYPRSIVGRAGWHTADTASPIGPGTWEAAYAAAQVATCAVDAVLDVDVHERGEGAGEGFNLNLPMPLGSGDEPWLAAGETALEQARPPVTRG